MNRRKLLKLASGLIALANICIVVIPGVGYIIGTVRRRPSGGKTVQRVIRLKDLPVGRPVELAITGRRRDAWTTYPKETIGRVWVMRRPSLADPSSESSEHEVEAYSTVCPHLGCAVKMASTGKTFICPCHQAGFQLDGSRLGQAELGHKNPSPRDLDKLECRIAPDDSGEAWVEVTYEKFKLGRTVKISQT